MGQPYSGEFGFVETEMYWPITHMVAPAEQALDCESCHARDGRLAGIEGIYIPGTGLPPGALAGLAILALAAAGVGGHGVLRIVGNRGKGSHHG